MTFRLSDVVVAGAEHGDHPALVTPGGTLTYGALADRARRVAAGLRAAGVGPGGRVGFLGPSGHEWAEVVLGAAWAGAVPVPLNWRLAGRELRAIVDDADTGVLVADQRMWNGIAADMERWPGRVIMFGAAGSYAAWRDARDPDPKPAGVGAGDTALQLYTSGTTAAPKGVMLTHKNLECLLVRGGPAVRVASHSRNLFTLPLFHIAGAGFALITLWAGAVGVVPPAVTPEALLEAISVHRITNTGLVPTIIASLLDHPQRNRFDLSSLEAVIYGAAPIPPALLERTLREIGCGFLHTYGLTESAGFVTILEPEEHDPLIPGRLRSCGRAVPWAEIRAAGIDTGEPLPPGTQGEIQVRSPQVMSGYWHQPQATAEAFTAHGWLRTGDVGHVDVNGYVFVVDRIKDLVITGGENVAPAEVEAVLAEHPAVRQVAVIGVPDPRWGETVKALVVASPAAPVDPAALIDFARSRLAHYKCPTSIDVVDDLPLNATGKVDRKVLRAAYAPSPPSNTEP